MTAPSLSARPAPSASGEAEPFWRRKRLDEMTRDEWESLCDGCGRCCLLKLIDEDTDKVLYTDVGCRLLDTGTGHCRHYPERQRHVPDCIALTPEAVGTIEWLPPTCAYRLVGEGRDLYPWHPLVSGDPDSPHAAGISVRGRVAGSEEEYQPEDLFDRTVEWPALTPEALDVKSRRSRN